MRLPVFLIGQRIISNLTFYAIYKFQWSADMHVITVQAVFVGLL